MKTFYFNTGVRPINNNPYLAEKAELIGGVYQISFQCEDVPDNAVFKFGSPYNNVPVPDNFICREIHNSILLSKYAYFKVI